MVGPTLNNIHATIESMTWNPHHRSNMQAGSTFYRQQAESANGEQCACGEISTRSSDATILVACAPPLVLDKSVSGPCLIKKGNLSTTGTRDQHAPLRKHHLSVQARSSFCELSSATFKKLGLYFFSRPKNEPFSAL